MAVLAWDAYGIFGARFPLLLALTVVSAFFEGLTLAMLLPLLNALGFPGAADNVVTLSILALFRTLGLAVTPVTVGMMLLGFVAISAVIFLMQARLAARLQTAYVAHWQRKVFDALADASWPFLRRQQTGDVIGALTTESVRLSGAFHQANLIASSAIFLCVQIGLAAIISPTVTLALLLLAAFLFPATQHLLRRSLRYGEELTRANAGLLATAGELLGAMKLVKATAQETAAKNRLAGDVARIEELSFRNAFDFQVVRAIFEYVGAAAVALLLVLGPLLLAADVASILMIVAIFVRLFPKVTGLRQYIQSIGLLLPAFDALQAIAQKGTAARERDGGSVHSRGEGPAAIRFRQVTVAGDADRAILHSINLDIVAGTFVAFVGPTGAGKTTVVDCVLGMVTPSAGEILVDDLALSSLVLREWRDSIGYLGQDPVLFAGTIRANILWGREGFSDQKIVEAIEAADATFVLRLPGGLDAMLGERGGSLSGGERQRIALARALLGTPRLLILDEATSALDVETERRIAAAVRTRRGRSTILAITHRLASVADADMIVLLENGRVIEHGTVDELVAREGRFFEFWRHQAEEDARTRSDILRTA
jgi:ATP-binding cassette subfamily C protein